MCPKKGEFFFIYPVPFCKKNSNSNNNKIKQSVIFSSIRHLRFSYQFLYNIRTTVAEKISKLFWKGPLECEKVMITLASRAWAVGPLSLRWHPVPSSQSWASGSASLCAAENRNSGSGWGQDERKNLHTQKQLFPNRNRIEMETLKKEITPTANFGFSFRYTFHSFIMNYLLNEIGPMDCCAFCRWVAKFESSLIHCCTLPIRCRIICKQIDPILISFFWLIFKLKHWFAKNIPKKLGFVWKRIIMSLFWMAHFTQLI